MANKRKIKIWLIAFISLVALFILLQVPAAWLINKFAPNLRMLQNVNGNIWHGQADWRLNNVQGTVHWSTRPWEIIRLRLASHLTIHSGQTQLQGVVGYSITKKIYINDLNGKLSPDTLSQVMPWQWPSTTINVKDTHLIFKKSQGFSDASGQVTWAGGSLMYPMPQRQERIDIPPLVVDVSAEKNKLKFLAKNTQQQRMADFVIGEDGMLDVQITQRFLMYSPSYKGQAGLDTAVISTRQPLRSLGGI